MRTQETPLAETPWGVCFAGAPAAHATGLDGDGEVIAIVDTGIDATHPCLSPRVLPGFNALAAPNSTYEDPGDTRDDNGHGTHCAGTAAASWWGGALYGRSFGLLGVAPRAKLLPVKVLDGTGRGSEAAVAAGIRWAADNGATVIGLSLGSPHPDSAIHEALLYAADRCWIACAAGNAGAPPPGSELPGFDDVLFPARYKVGVPVAAIDQDLTPAYFSSVGPEVFVAGPGVDVLSCAPGGGYATFSGTSMACPHVAGLLALGRQAVRLGRFHGDQWTWLSSRVFPLAASVPNPRTGYGLTSMLAPATAATLRRLQLQIGQTGYTLDGAARTTDVAPTIVQDRTFVPVRVVAEAFGATVEWDQGAQEAVLHTASHICRIPVGRLYCLIDGVTTPLEAPTFLQPVDPAEPGGGARAMVPLRLVAQALGAQVTWHPATRQITVLAAVTASGGAGG